MPAPRTVTSSPEPAQSMTAPPVAGPARSSAASPATAALTGAGSAAAGVPTADEAVSGLAATLAIEERQLRVEHADASRALAAVTGQDLIAARARLRYGPGRTCEPLARVLDAAAVRAERAGLDPSLLLISGTAAEPAEDIVRVRRKAHGKADWIHSPTSRILITLRPAGLHATQGQQAAGAPGEARPRSESPFTDAARPAPADAAGGTRTDPEPSRAGLPGAEAADRPDQPLAPAKPSPASEHAEPPCTASAARPVPEPSRAQFPDPGAATGEAATGDIATGDAAKWDAARENTVTGDAASAGGWPAAVREALFDVIDPDLGVNIVDLGFVRDIRAEGRTAVITMTLTSAACPLTGVMEDQIRAGLAGLPDLDGFRVDWVWLPAWHPRDITPSGREQLHAIGFTVG